MTIPDRVFDELLEQLRISEGRLLSQVDDLSRVRPLLAELADVLRQGGLDRHTALVERIAEIVVLAAAEVGHAATSYRRAVHRTTEVTQPITVPRR